MAYYIQQNNCTSCGNCADVCSNGAIVQLPDGFKINPLWCIECGSCEVMCYEKAIFYEGLDTETSYQEVMIEDFIVYFQEIEIEEFALF